MEFFRFDEVSQICIVEYFEDFKYKARSTLMVHHSIAKNHLLHMQENCIHFLHLIIRIKRSKRQYFKLIHALQLCQVSLLCLTSRVVTYYVALCDRSLE